MPTGQIWPLDPLHSGVQALLDFRAGGIQGLCPLSSLQDPPGAGEGAQPHGQLSRCPPWRKELGPRATRPGEESHPRAECRQLELTKDQG